MNKFVYALLFVGLFSCKKETGGDTPENPQNPQNPPPPVAVCKIQSLKEFPAVDGKSSTTTFTYNDQNRVVKLEKLQNNVTISRTVTYNTDNKIDKITYAGGANEQFRYANGQLSEWEVFNESGAKVKKYTFTFSSGKPTRVDKFLFNGTAYDNAGFVNYEWDNLGNITAIKEFEPNATTPNKTFNYTYYTDKVNKQKELAPQLELFFLDWVSDVTAFINSNNMLQTTNNTARTLTYVTNNKGYITTVKGNTNDSYFTFAYSDCD